MKKKILIFGIIGIILIGVVTTLLLLNKSDKTLEFNEQILNDITIDNGLLLTNSKLECLNDVCTMTITANNNTTDNIDMSNYRISFLDSSGEEIYWYSGVAIGVVEGNKKTEFSLELPSNLPYIDKITYNENYF